MLNTWVLTAISIIVVSLIAGFIFYYVVSNISKQEKKKELEELSSMLINFIIFIWVGKILLNFSIFIQDPLAILAYPSNSYAFYIAVFLTLLNIGYKVIRHHFNAISLLNTFVPVFLSASFVYEFIQIVWNGNTYMWGYLGLLMVLLILFLFFQQRTEPIKLSIMLLAAWGIGQIVLSQIMSFTAVFGYMMTPIFLIFLVVICFVGLIYISRKKVS